MSILAHKLRKTPQQQVGGDEAGVAYTSVSTLSGVTSATKTFTSVDIGTPNADRYVIVALQWVNTSSTPSISSATINGVSASVATSRSVFYNTAHGVFFAKVPTGTSVTIVANLSDTTLSGYNENIAVYTINAPTLSLERDVSLYSTSTNSVAFTGIASRFDDVATNEFLISNVTLNGVRDDISVDELSEDAYQTSATGTNFYASYNNNTESLQDIAPTFSWGGGTLNVTATIYRFSYSPLDYEADFGTPTYTITSFPSTASGANNGSNDVLIAFDAQLGTSSGLIMELGGTAAGLAIGTDGAGSLRFRCYDASTAWSSINVDNTAFLDVDISSYKDSYCTYYFTVDASSQTLRAYVQLGGKGSNSELVTLGSDTATADDLEFSVYGGAAKGYLDDGTDAAFPDLETEYEGVPFTVSAGSSFSEIRYWAEDPTLDVSTFGTL